MRRAQKRFVLQTQNTAALEHVLAGEVMKLRRAHRVLKLCACDDVAKERIGLQQDVIVEKDVVDANDALFAQDAIIEIMQAAAHLQANSKMSVVVTIGSWRDNRIYKLGAHQAHYCGQHKP